MAHKASLKMFHGHHMQSDVTFSQVVENLNQSNPFSLNLNRGFTQGCELVLVGVSKPGVDTFNINLMAGGDIAFHLSVRFRDGVVVRNSKRNNSWEHEERDGFLPIHPGQQFTISIACENDGYKVSINGTFFTYFKHRVSAGLVNKLDSNSNVHLSQITYQALMAGKGSPASSGCRIELQNGFSSGTELIITGMAQAYQERFSIEFERGPEKVLTFTPLFREGVVERSSFTSGRWGLKERDGGLPFRMGVTFNVLFKCEPDGYKIYVDGKLFSFFKHRHPGIPVSHVNFTGSIVISKVIYKTRQESYRGDDGGKWSYVAPSAPPPIPSRPKPQPSWGIPEEDKGGRWYGEPPLYPELVDELSSAVSKVGKDWDYHEPTHSSGLTRAHSSFDVSTESQKECNRGRNRNRNWGKAKRSHTPVLIFRRAAAKVTFPFTQEFDSDWKSSPYKLVLNQGFDRGSEITIVGEIPYGSDRFHVNLVQRNGDIGFHFAPRFGEGVVVRNTRLGGSWNREERDGGLPLFPGDHFTISISGQDDSYKVFVNNSVFTVFRYRSGGIISYVEVGGEVSVKSMVYQTVTKTSGANIPLQNGFLPGSEVTLFGEVDSDRDRFSVDLESPGSVTEKFLHFEVLWRENLALLNSFLNGYWGHDERERGISVYPGTSVRINIKCESDGFQLYLNDSFLAFYRHRLSPHGITNMAVRDGMQLNMVRYNTKL